MTDRTKQAALDALLSNREEVARKLQDTQLVELLSESLVKNVFDEAWRLQYEEDEQKFPRAVRDLVEDAAEKIST